MTKLLNLTVVAALALVVTVPGNAQNSFSLDEVLSNMAASGGEFETLKAQVARDEVNGLINRHYENSGEAYIGARGGDMMIRVDILAPEASRQQLLVVGGMVQNYNPRTKQVQEGSLGDRSDIVALMAVGFGPGNADLSTNFEIELVGEEDLNGVPTSLIELVPQDEEFLRFAERIRLWVGQEDWIPIQQRLQPPGVNYVIVTYSEFELNTGLPDSTWSLDLPDDVEVIKF